MCRYCYTNEISSLQTYQEKKTYYRHPHFGSYCRVIYDPKRKIDVVSNWFAVLPTKAMILIILYTDQWDIPYLLEQCDRQLYDLFAKGEYWRSLCMEWWSMSGGYYAYLRPNEEDIGDIVDIIMPNTLCSSNWRSYYRLCCRKVDWLSSMQRKVKELSSFLPLYQRIKNQNFGSSRIFSKEYDIFIVSDSRLLNFQLLEESIYRTKPTVERSLSSSVVLSLRMIQPEPKNDENTYIMATLTIVQFPSFISFQHIAEAMDELAKHDCNISASSRISLPNPTFAMPYEIYVIMPKNPCKIKFMFLMHIVSLLYDYNHHACDA